MKTRKFAALFLALCLALSLAVFADGEHAADVTTPDGQVTAYPTLEDALDNAPEGSRVTLRAEYTLSTDATVKAGVTLVIPTNDDVADTTEGNNFYSDSIDHSPFRTLTVAENVNLKVDGTLLVAGNQQGCQPEAGCLTGKHGNLVVNGVVTLNSGASLYARGTVSGAGEITANSGSSVYQLFQIHDWRGGTAATKCYTFARVFPFNFYEVNNIAAKTTYQNGSNLIAQYYIYASNTGNAGELKIIGSDGLFQFANSEAADHNVVAESKNGINTVTVNGALTVDGLQVTVGGRSLSSSSRVAPFGYKMSITIADGGSLAFTQDTKIIPGGSIKVENGGTLSVANDKTLYVYTKDAYRNDFVFQAAVPEGDATLTVEKTGTVTGAIASNDVNFSNVTGVAYGTSGTATIKEYISGYTGTKVTFCKVTIQ